MQAATIDSKGARGASSDKNRDIIRSFDAALWLQRWAKNGNSVELMSDGKMWVLYGSGGRYRRRDALEIQLVRRKGVGAVKSFLAENGMRRFGEAAI